MKRVRRAVQRKRGVTASVSHGASNQVRENQDERKPKGERTRERDVVVHDDVKTDLKGRGDSGGREIRE